MDIVYENHKGNEISLYRWPLMLQNPEMLFGYGWKYDSNKRSISNFSKEIVEKTCTISIFAESKEEYMNVINMITEVIEVDVLNETPGKIKVNGYYLNCFITGSDFEEWEEDFYSTDKKIKIAAVNGSWIKEKQQEFISSEYDTSDGFDYPFDYPFDYGINVTGNSVINNDYFSSSDFIIKISGYAFEPLITIGDNQYKINDLTIGNNEVLTIDSRNKTIILTKKNGVNVNCFSKRDKGHYIFEKIKPGNNSVYWNGEYNWSLTLIEERSEPKWI